MRKLLPVVLAMIACLFVVRTEAEIDLRLGTIKEPDKALETAMWQLYDCYAEVNQAARGEPLRVVSDAAFGRSVWGVDSSES
jgi:hypothetical protein